ncbi:MAG: hypothetical protein WC792_04370 [Candidatus Micrarchaeia archaeon]|jgi:hypothetical protein
MKRLRAELLFLAILLFAGFFNALGLRQFSFDVPVVGYKIDLQDDAFSSMKNSLGPWYDAVVTREEVDAAIWADENVAQKDLFAADLFACEMLTAVSRKICSIGGAWELADRPNERFQDNEKAFMTNSSGEAFALLSKYGIKYVFASNRQAFYAYGWKQPDLGKFSDKKFFEKIYDKAGVKIWRVKRA